MFSRIPTNQAHEQNKATVKGEGDAIRITQNEVALWRWMVGGREIARLVQEFEISMEQKTPSAGGEETCHHEQKSGQ